MCLSVSPTHAQLSATHTAWGSRQPAFSKNAAAYCRRKELMASVRKPREKLCASAFQPSNTRKKGTESGLLRRSLCVRVCRMRKRGPVFARRPVTLYSHFMTRYRTSCQNYLLNLQRGVPLQSGLPYARAGRAPWQGATWTAYHMSMALVFGCPTRDY